MWNIITYWTFDLFHYGHLELLRRAKKLAWDDSLIVWVSTDDFNKLKWKECIIPYKQRKEIVEAIKYVDLVIPEHIREQKEYDIKRFWARFVMWDDRRWKFDDLWCTYLKRTPDISTTQLKLLIPKCNNENNICMNA